MDNLQETFLSTEGKLTRLQYFKLMLAVGVVEIILACVTLGIFSDDYGIVSNTGENLNMLILLAALVPYYFLTVKRIHDFAGDEFLAKLTVGLQFYYIVFNYTDPFNMSTFDNMLSFANFLLVLYLVFNPSKYQ